MQLLLLTSNSSYMVSTAASASGTLERTPPIYLLVSLLERQLTGTLVLETQTGAKSALNFVRGVPNKLKAAEPVARFGTLLVEFGYLDDSTCESSHAESTQAKCLHGQYLVQSGAIDTNILNRALRSQLLLKLQWFCGLPVATAYGFYEHQDFLSRWAGDGISVSPLLVLWDLTRTSSNLPNLSERTKRFESRVLVLDSRALLDAFGFETNERRLLKVLRDEPQTLQDLRALNLVTEPVLQRLLYVLSLTRHIGLAQDAERATPLGVGLGLESSVELLRGNPPPAARPNASTTERAAPARVTGPAAAARRSAAPLDPQREREITEKRRVISSMTEGYDTYDYYELLGVPRGATAAEIQTAFFEAAKRFHPDKLGAELADLRASSARLFARMSEARQTLTDPESRQQYDAKLGHGVTHDDEDDEQKRIHEIINAATCFQKAEVLLKKRMLAEAEKEALRAHESDPEQADYIALLAWINASKTESNALLPESLAQLNMAVSMSPENDKIRFYRAQILSRLGKKQEALADYKFVVTKNPRNIDAQRELRLSEMRKSQQSSPALTPELALRQSSAPLSKGGVFGKFFKR